MFFPGKLLVLIQEPFAVNGERKPPERALQTSLLSSCVVRTQDVQLPGFLVESPEYREELKTRTLQVLLQTGAVSFLQEKITGGGWLSTRCPCS